MSGYRGVPLGGDLPNITVQNPSTGIVQVSSDPTDKINHYTANVKDRSLYRQNTGGLPTNITTIQAATLQYTPNFYAHTLEDNLITFTVQFICPSLRAQDSPRYYNHTFIPPFVCFSHPSGVDKTDSTSNGQGWHRCLDGSYGAALEQALNCTTDQPLVYQPPNNTVAEHAAFASHVHVPNLTGDVTAVDSLRVHEYTGVPSGGSGDLCKINYWKFRVYFRYGAGFRIVFGFANYVDKDNAMPNNITRRYFRAEVEFDPTSSWFRASRVHGFDYLSQDLNSYNNNFITSDAASTRLVPIAASSPWGLEFNEPIPIDAQAESANDYWCFTGEDAALEGGYDWTCPFWALQATSMPYLTNTKNIMILCPEVTNRRTCHNAVGGFDWLGSSTLATIPISYEDFGQPQSYQLDLASFIRMNTYEEAPDLLTIHIVDQDGVPVSSGVSLRYNYFNPYNVTEDPFHSVTMGGGAINNPNRFVFPFSTPSSCNVDTGIVISGSQPNRLLFQGWAKFEFVNIFSLQLMKNYSLISNDDLRGYQARNQVFFTVYGTV